jgi:hypothetical protein
MAQLYEALGTKRVGIYHIPRLSAQNRAAILDRANEQQYGFSPHDDWTITSCRKVNGKALLALSKVALQPVKATLWKADFDDKTWKAIGDTARIFAWRPITS